MANKRYRADKIIANAMHYPAVGDTDNPLFLYSKVPEYDGRTENSEIGYSQNKHYSEWSKKKESVYSSPRNIRSVYIHSNGVSILTFTEPVGVKGVRHSRKYLKIDSDDILYGNPLTALSKPVVCSNIEEVYIDISIIIRVLEQDPIFANEVVSNTGNNTIQELIKLNSSTGIMAESNIPINILKMAGSVSFNRLRTVAITKNIYTGYEDRFLAVPTKESKYSRTIEVRANELKQQQCSAMVSRINSNNKSYGSLATSPNIYMFDRNVLYEWASKFRQEFTGVIKNHSIKEDTSTKYEQKNSILIDEIERLDSKYGKKVTDMIIKSAIPTMRKNDIEQIRTILVGRM